MTATTQSRSTRSAETLRDFLTEVETAVNERPAAMVFYAPPGLGKTSFGAAIPKALFLVDDKELGIHTLKRSGQVAKDVPVLPPIKNWLDLLACVRQVAAGKHDHKALIVDTMGGCERLCHQHVCETMYRGDWAEKGFAGYGRGYESALPEWRLLLEAFDECRDAGMSVVLLTHAIIKPYKNPLGEDFDRFVPDVHHKTWNLTHRWADVVLFGNYHVEVDDSSGRAKGRGGDDRYFYCEYSAAWEAKNRHGLPPEIAMGRSGKEAWANLTKAMKEAAK